MPWRNPGLAQAKLHLRHSSHLRNGPSGQSFARLWGVRLAAAQVYSCSRRASPAALQAECRGLDVWPIAEPNEPTSRSEEGSDLTYGAVQPLAYLQSDGGQQALLHSSGSHSQPTVPPFSSLSRTPHPTLHR